MKWEDFKAAHHLRIADKCCLNCAYGCDDFEGENYCYHPDIAKGQYTRAHWSDVCDLWEKAKEGGAA